MAKTQWADGEHLTPAQMILFFGNNAATGHDHDGTDVDGSCPKIITEGTVGVKITTSHLTVEQTATWYYAKLQNYILLFIDELLGTSNSVNLRIYPQTTWPAEIVPTTLQRAYSCLRDNSSWVPGMIEIDTDVSDYWVCQIIDTNHDYSAGIFTAANLKGISKQVIMFSDY